MRKATIVGAVLVAIAMAGATNASATSLTLSNVSGDWFNPVPIAGITINNQAGSNVDSVRWGTPQTTAGQSGYNFDPVDGAFTPLLGTPFLLGTFTHINQPITGTTLASISYSFSLDTNGIPNSLTDTFNFIHDETPNSSVNGLPSGCAPGPLGSGPHTTVCDDFVTVSSVGLNQVVDVGGSLYFFNLLGFSTDGGVTIRSLFQSPEGSSNSAGLYAVVTEQPIGGEVPEPGSLVLMGTGVLAVARRLRRPRSGK
jgi:hypothetical protein